jgi:uncharacterized protein YkwD
VETGKYELVPNSGPRRAVQLSPSGVCDVAIRRPNAGPKRGIGPYLGLPQSLSTGGSPDDQICLTLTNKFRKENGLPPLAYSKALCDVARPHTLAMLEGKVKLGHAGFHDRRAKLLQAASMGENVAYTDGYANPVQTMVDNWIKSPGHRRNMLGDFSHLGTVFEHRGDVWYGIQLFGLL